MNPCFAFSTVASKIRKEGIFFPIFSDKRKIFNNKNLSTREIEIVRILSINIF